MLSLSNLFYQSISYQFDLDFEFKGISYRETFDFL